MNSNILLFWNWFSQNEAQFRTIRNEAATVELLNNQVLTFGNFAWGIDRGLENKFVFTISPNNDKRLLSVSKQMIDLAPDLSNWEFRYCKAPEVDWDFKFQTFNDFMIMQTFDASRWQFVLIEEEDYRIRIEIKANNMATLSIDDQNFAADRAVTRILGEELYIKEVHTVVVVDSFDPRDEDWIYPMQDLRERFLYFVG